MGVLVVARRNAERLLESALQVKRARADRRCELAQGHALAAPRIEISLCLADDAVHAVTLTAGPIGIYPLLARIPGLFSRLQALLLGLLSLIYFLPGLLQRLLCLLELLLSIEKQYGVFISPDKLPDLMSVGAIMAAVNGAAAAA